MNSTYQRIIGSLTIISGIIAFVSYFLVACSVNFNFDFFSNPKLVFSIPDVNFSMLRWSMITDIFGYYLLLLPALIFMHGWLKSKTEWSKLISVCGLFYIMIGATGAAILAAVWPALLLKHAQISAQQQEIIENLFEAFSLMVGNGLWNILDALLCGIWLTCLGMVLKKDYNLIGLFTIMVGIISLFDSFGNILDIKIVADIAVNLYLILAPLWAIVLGIIILTKNNINSLKLKLTNE